MSRKTPYIIVYHAQCLDGLGSAWVLAKYIPHDHPVTYIPYGHHESIMAKDKIRTTIQQQNEKTILYFVDVAPRKIFLDELCATDILSEIHIYDHHITAQKLLSDFTPPNTATKVIKHIDASYPSATKMIWDMLIQKHAPDLITTIDKMDRGEGLKTDDDFAAAEYLDNFNTSSLPEMFAMFATLENEKFKTFADRGRDWANTQKQHIDDLMKTVAYIHMDIAPDTDPVPLPIVHGKLKTFGRRISYELTQLSKTTSAPIAMIWQENDNGTISLSLRSDGTTDVGAIATYWAEKHGTTGGGHATAAAVHFPDMGYFKENILKSSH